MIGLNKIYKLSFFGEVQEVLKELFLARDGSERKEQFLQGPRWIGECLKLSEDMAAAVETICRCADSALCSPLNCSDHRRCNASVLTFQFSFSFSSFLF